MSLLIFSCTLALIIYVDGCAELACSFKKKNLNTATVKLQLVFARN